MGKTYQRLSLDFLGRFCLASRTSRLTLEMLMP
jgi:hypothetical protein